ncbi:MAG: hypothetical protein NTZ54_19645 [Alphaproteobacteria bacterium]|nr:hypothetical protein [Alphaproteobacteria bacterium]
MTLNNASLEVTVNPQVGGTVMSIRHVATGLSVLGSVAWETVGAPIDSVAARDEPEWLTRFTGGWPLLFPNAGDACQVDGVFHGFHGEASIAPWRAEMEGGALILSRRFSTLPAVMRRTMSLSGETLTIREELHYSGTQSIDVMWGHHPTFGSDLLAGPFEVSCGAREVRAEAQYDPPTNPLRPGVSGRWPSPQGKHGIVDLAHPTAPWASVAYLGDFASRMGRSSPLPGYGMSSRQQQRRHGAETPVSSASNQTPRLAHLASARRRRAGLLCWASPLGR